jgi:hypothetical protein
MSIFSRLFGGKGESRSVARGDRANPALDYIKSKPPDFVTETLIAAFPSLSASLFSEAGKLAQGLGLNDHLFVECVLDLELVGGLDKVVEFAGDKALASAYVDAIIFDLTDKNPSAVPSELEFQEGGTERYRGIAKYAMAADYFRVPSPGAWLFGREYSGIKTGNAKDLAQIVSARPAFSVILKAGASIFEHMLFERMLDWSTPSVGKPEKALTFEELKAAVQTTRNTKEQPRED